MKIFRFDRETGRRSIASTARALPDQGGSLLEETMIQYAYFAPGGLVGYHQVTVPQLFLIFQGEGWVRGQASE
jgi:hypothetical protein